MKKTEGRLKLEKKQETNGSKLENKKQSDDANMEINDTKRRDK